MSPSWRRPKPLESVEPDRGLDARVAAYLRDGPERAPAHLLGAAAEQVHLTRQRRRDWRLGASKSSWAAVAAALAIVVLVSPRLQLGPGPAAPGASRPPLALASIGSGREPSVVQRIATPTVVRAVFVIDGAVWAVLVDGLVFEVSPVTGEVLTQLDARLDAPTGAAASSDAVWVGSADGDLVGIDLASRSVTADVDVGIAHHAVAASDDAVWIAGRATARRIDAATLTVSEFALPPGVVDLAAVRGDVWATYPAGQVMVVDGSTAAVRGTVHTIPEASAPGGLIATGGDDVWIAETAGGGSVHRVDMDRGVIAASIGFVSPSGPTALAADPLGAWVLFGDQGILVRIDRDGLRIVDTIEVGLGARGISGLPNGLGLWGAGGIRILDVQLRS